MLTIFTAQRPFEGHIDLIQRNALMSWKSLKNSPQIILVGKEKGSQDICKEFDIDFIPDVKVSSCGTPYVNDVFKRAQEKARYNIMAFVNTDIILMDDFINGIIKVSERFKDFLLVGQRYDIEVKERIDFKDSLWKQNLRNKIKKEGKLHASYGIDYHVFRKGFWTNIPSFVIGRSAYDNWLIAQAITDKRIIIDGTEAICIVHQNHEHGKLKDGSNILGGPEAVRNRGLAGNIQYGSSSNANWKLTNKMEIYKK